jgi:hypothetical protein
MVPLTGFEPVPFTLLSSNLALFRGQNGDKSAAFVSGITLANSEAGMTAK